MLKATPVPSSVRPTPRIPRLPRTRIFPASPPPRLPPSARRAHPVLWKPPLRPGALPAYDEALRYIRADARALRTELAALKTAHAARAAVDAQAGRAHDEEAAGAYREKRRVLEVMAAVNLPEVRFAFLKGKFPFAQPVYRHLTEQKWRKDGALDLLMERLHQMHVIPDLLPALHPTLDLRVQFRAPAPTHARAFVPVPPGAFLRPAQTLAPPRVSATVFHPEPRLYTLLLLDPDVPDESHSSFQTYLHWLQPNIPLSGTRRITLLPPAPTAPVPYVPPHPQRGTPYHRYVLLLLPHAAPLPPAALAAPRAPFDLRAFCAQWGIEGGGGAHMWRAVWDETVSGVYRDVLNTPEPHFGRPPKPDLFAHRARPRYALSR